MPDDYGFKELTETQRQTHQIAVQLYQAHLEIVGQNRSLRGGMHWKKIRGREYLYRYRDRYGHGQSLGPRSEPTERIFDDFARQRQEASAHLRGQRLRLEEQARFCRAALIHRVPKMAVKILRLLEQDGLGRNLLVIGTAALYAYEFAAGVFFESSGVRDLFGSSRRGLTLVGDGQMSWDDLVPLLRRANRSFAPVPGADGRAVSRDGFQVRLIKSEARRPGRPKTVTVPGAREPLPPEAGNLHYLAASPKLTQVVIGKDGWPATLVVPDPRAFALHRLWLSQQKDRGAAQRAQDLNQALAVAALTLRHLPQYDFSPSELEMFPQDLGQEEERFAVEITEDEIKEY
jgi:hypothetical protein